MVPILHQDIKRNKLEKLDSAMEKAGRGLSNLIMVREAIERTGPLRVRQLTEEILTFLSDVEEPGRVAQNYAIALFFAEMVTKHFSFDTKFFRQIDTSKQCRSWSDSSYRSRLIRVFFVYILESISLL